MIRVIAAEVDGKALREQKKGAWLRAPGKHDEEAIQEAINHRPGGLFIACKDWERIFGHGP